jgi:hypothetical protein
VVFVAIRSRRVSSRVEIRTKNRSQGFWWGVVEIFCLLPHSILALLSKPSFDAAVAGPFVT